MESLEKSIEFIIVCCCSICVVCDATAAAPIFIVVVLISKHMSIQMAFGFRHTFMHSHKINGKREQVKKTHRGIKKKGERLSNAIQDGQAVCCLLLLCTCQINDMCRLLFYFIWNEKQISVLILVHTQHTRFSDAHCFWFD